MLNTLDAADRAVVQQWIALSDVVTCLQCGPRAYQIRGDRSITQALEAVVAYEHQLPRFLRLVAREALWRRDFPTTSLPSGRDWWAQCQCRVCFLERRRTASDRRLAVYEVQLAAVRRQRHT